MKISKTRLRTIIKEELAAIQAEAEEVSRRNALRRLGAGAAGLAIGAGVAKEAGAGDYVKAMVKRKAQPFLKDAQLAIVEYLQNNADDLADHAVPDIPFDGDIIESLMKQTISAAIAANAEEIADCTMGFVTPDFLASLENLDDETAKRYAQE